MTELISAIQDYALWLYALLGVLVIREFLKIWRSGRERQHAMFGLEREAATGKSTRSLVVILLLVTIAVGVYATARVIAPAVLDGESLARDSAPLYVPPQKMSLPTDTPRPRPTPSLLPPRIVTAPPDRVYSDSDDTVRALCLNPNVDIVSPGPGDVLSAPTEVVVTVRLAEVGPGAYRVDIGRGLAPETWTALLTDQRDSVENKGVVTLDVASLESGDYTLRLALMSPGGETETQSACSVTVRIP